MISLVALLLLGCLVAAGGTLYVFWTYGQGLPDYKQLADYQPPTTTRVYAEDGRLLEEYAKEKRVFVPIEAMPRRVINAFLSAEDKNFYQHPGVDFPSIIAAAYNNLKRLGTDQRPVGASTITQQVAKNFLLTNEVSIERKIREAILAFRMEQTFTKDRILELYLNEIYLGSRSYGVAAAALNYFNKSLDNLTVAEAAYLAALPKAPNNYQVDLHPDAAKARRDWVIRQMHENGYIDADTAQHAQDAPIETRRRDATEIAEADYFGEEVRRELIQLYGEDKVYGGGMSVRATLDPELQRYAKNALQDGLIAYDREHGWRGAQRTLDIEGRDAPWQSKLQDLSPPGGMPESWRQAVVVAVGPDAARVGFTDGSTGLILMSGMDWARPQLKNQRVGAKPRRPEQVVSIGDVVLVSAIQDSDNFRLEQMPQVSGAIIALDPHTGRVLAMQGGFSFDSSQFNRATQAGRQPGSSFKPFVYLSALENGYTPATIILDAPFVIDQGQGLGKWKPANYSGNFYGPTPMRVGIEQSKNLMTVRLAQSVGMDKISNTAERFGIYDHLPHQLAMALGAGETKLLKLATAYGQLVNGGKNIKPTLIDRVQDREGKTIFKHDDRPCPGCDADLWLNQQPPEIPDDRAQVTDPASAYQIVSMLRGVVERGTGRRMRSLNRPLAGKTGTTNDSVDTWFMGFSPDLVAGVYVGFDNPRTLGPNSFGSNTAGPIWKQFMQNALEGEPKVPFRIPSGIKLVRMNLDTGQPARPGDDNVILEAFKTGNSPAQDRRVIGQGQTAANDNSGSSSGQNGGAQAPADTGTGGGLY
ncbi:penicillin-binding protein 1A [Rhodovibrio salinarum]|uniref:penicillin-binding protein 1A n=1 Tax=Rhodovibrio salinarum TaxID=1087 RepID=UPI0004BCB773|nr:penicillin-binding protein 1A [Rhodovibrio salinarum]